MAVLSTANPAEPAATAIERRGRPKGTKVPRMKTWKFDLNVAVEKFMDIASRCHHPEWNWDGTMYPKTKRSQGPSQDALQDHSDVINILLQLAPNGYPDPYILRNVLMQLHGIKNYSTTDLEGVHSAASRLSHGRQFGSRRQDKILRLEIRCDVFE